MIFCDFYGPILLINKVMEAVYVEDNSGNYYMYMCCIFFDRFSRKGERLNEYVYKEKFIWTIAIVASAIFAGLRTRYNDTGTYLETYNLLTNSDFDFWI